MDESELDGIQKDMVGFNRKIQPTYAPKVATEKSDGKTLVVLWVPTGMQRPYKTTEHVTSKKDNHYKYVIRYNSSSVVANPEQERELLAMTSWQAFDEQGNTEATLDDISPILLIEHLRATGSRLAGQVRDRGVKEILGEMELLTGPSERQLLKNVALMMFCENPCKFFPDTQVEIVKFPRGAIKDPNNFIEVPPIRGSVPQIISRTMTTIKDMVIAERVEKVNYKMEANRYLSYPYAALEEVIVNAFYHRDYMCHQPVHVEIEPEFITVISYPGIDRSIPDEVIRKGERFRSRYYRNRRLGSFLKELDLCEGHCTGIPTIQEEL